MRVSARPLAGVMHSGGTHVRSWHTMRVGIKSTILERGGVTLILRLAAKRLGHAPQAMRDKGEVHALVMRVIRTAHLAAAVVSRGLAPRAVRGAQLAAAAKPMHLGHAPPATRDRGADQGQGEG